MSATAITCVLSAVALLTNNVHTFQPCETTDGEPGDCIPLKHCDSLYSNGQTSSSVSDQLRKSHCGDNGKYPRVCCPIKDQSLENIFVANSDLLPDSNICGIQTSEKIVGGETAGLDEFPWMALLQYNTAKGKVFECGGTLINKRYVLTAAHCLKDDLVSVTLGEYNINTNPDCIHTRFGEDDCAPPSIDFDIEEKIIHHSYSNSSLYHDIGLIRLSRDVEFSDFIRPICLPITADEAFKNYVGQSFTVAGWGLTENNVPSSCKLKANVPVVDLTECMKSYSTAYINLSLNDGQICAGGTRRGDSCKGDSGGPLMNYKIDSNKDAHFYAVGVVSFGATPCGVHKLPGGYTRISKYISWIVNALRP